MAKDQDGQDAREELGRELDGLNFQNASLAVYSGL
jgi:hypothetical protein